MILLGLVILLLVAVNTSPVQNFLAKKATNYLSEKLNAQVSVDKVSIQISNGATLQGVKLMDQHNDTLVYVGELGVRLTDWFLFKKDPTITYIKLSHAVIHLRRGKDGKEWNYDFISKAFASKNPKKKKSNFPDFNLDKILLSDVHFGMYDAWRGEDMLGDVGNLLIDADDIDFKHKKIFLNKIDIEGLSYGLHGYTGGRPPQPKNKKPDPIDYTPFNKNHWSVACKSLLVNGRFFMHDYEQPMLAGEYQPWHMDIKPLQIKAHNLSILNDTIKARLDNLSAYDRSGVTVKHMEADVTVSPRMSECKNLVLVTNHSTLRDYYVMRYPRFPAFKNYVTQVVMEGNLKNAKIGVGDIVYFTKKLKRFENVVVNINGKGGGSVSNLFAKNFVVTDGQNTFSGNSFTMKGLTNMDTTVIDLKNADLHTQIASIYKYVPELSKIKDIQINSLGNIHAAGNYRGTIRDFVADGAIATSIGSVSSTKMMVKLPKDLPTSYEGQLTVQNFDFSKIFVQKTIQLIDADIHLKGRDFDPKLCQISTDGHINLIQITGKNLRNINFKSIIDHQLIKGDLSADGTNLTLALNSTIDFSKPIKAYEFHATVDKWNAGAMGFLPGNTQLSGVVDAQFNGMSADSFLGEIDVQHLNILKDNQKLNFDNLTVIAAQEAGKRKLSVNTAGINAVLTGNYSLVQLPNTVQFFLNKYFPIYVDAPAKVPKHQHIDFAINTLEQNQVLELISSSLHISDSSHISGEIDNDNMRFVIKGDIPHFDISGNQFRNIKIIADGTNERLNLETLFSGLYTSNDKKILDSLDFQSFIEQSKTKFSIKTATAGSIGQAILNGNTVSEKGKIVLQIVPSEILFNNNVWKIPDGNKITYAKNYLDIQNLQFLSGNQSLKINEPSGLFASSSNPNEANIEVDNLNLEPLSRLTGLDQVKFGGSVTGTIQVNPLIKNQNVIFDLATKDAHINGDTLGTITALGSYDVAQKVLKMKEGSSVKFNDASIDILGQLALDTTSNQRLDAKVVLNNARVSWIAPILQNIVADLDGKIDGVINFSGNEQHPKTSGELTLKNLTFKPIVTGVKYIVREGHVSVSESEFNLGNITLEDDLGNKAIATGKVLHNHLRQFVFNADVSCNKMHVVKLSPQEGTRYYGDIFVKTAQLSIRGPWNDFRMNITGTPGPNSHIFIPVVYGRDLNNYGFIRFKEKQGDVLDSSAGQMPQSKIRYSIRLQATATPDLDATVLLDPTNGGDKIYGKGNGNFVMDIPSDGDMHLNGNYVIESGTYDFTFKQMQVLNYNRQFIINSGSTVKWNGDPFNAEMDVSAYAPVRARLYDLISAEVQRLNLTSQEVRDAQLLQTVDVEMSLVGTMDNHKLEFNIDLPDKRSMGTYAYQKLERINNNEQQKLNQVFALLVLEQFIPPEGLLNTSATIQSGTINNMSELFASAASSQITTFANKLLGMNDLYIGVTYRNYNLTGVNDISTISSDDYLNRNQAGVNLRKNFWNNRVVVDVGGTYDWGRPGAQASTTGSLAGDFRVQYLITPDGKLRLNVFSTSNYDAIYQQTISRQGAGISYRRSFNNLGDFFNFKRKPQVEPNWDSLDFLKLVNPTQKASTPIIPGQYLPGGITNPNKYK